MAKLDFTQSYSFSDYINLDIEGEEICRELGFELRFDYLDLPSEKTLPLPQLPDITENIQETLNIVSLSNETARREIFIAPILFNLTKLVKGKLYFEYPLNINNYLKGRIDYYIKSKNSLLIVEAKQEDLTKGLIQLAIELIAFSKINDKLILYGVITSGQVWQFVALNNHSKIIENLGGNPVLIGRLLLRFLFL